PKHTGYRFRRDAVKVRDAKPENKTAREATFMGLGDLVMPSILVVAVLAFGPYAASSYTSNIHLFDIDVHRENAAYNDFASASGSPTYQPVGLLAGITPEIGIAYGSYVHGLHDHVAAHAPPASAPASVNAS